MSKRLPAFFLASMAFALCGWTAPAQAEITSKSPSAFVITGAADVAAPRDRVWTALGQIGRWWSPAHSYSHDPQRRMRLDLRAGGCFCETWSGGAVEHGRVIAIYADQGVRTLRLSAPLGPLQATGATGVLTFEIAPNASGAHLTVTYRVAGDPNLGLDQMAEPVDTVVMEQLTRLVRYSETGAPE